MTGERLAGPAGALHVDDGGAGGLPVIFVHAFAGNAAQWSVQLHHIRRTRRAAAFDLRGHGRSAPPAKGDYRIEALADDIGAVADGLGFQRFALVGHSLGAAASIAYAGAQPDRVAGLVLVGAPGRVPEEQARNVLAAIEKDYNNVMQGYWDQLLAGARPDVRTQVVSTMGSLDKYAASSIIDATFSYDPLPALRRYPGPKLAVVTPGGDTPHDLHHLLPGVPHRRFEGTSHWLFMDAPDEFNRLLEEFLASID